MTKRRSYRAVAFALCMALAVSLIPGMAFAEIETDFDLENEREVTFDALNKMDIVPTDFSTISRKGEEVVVHIAPKILDEVDGTMVSELIESAELDSGDRISINNIGYSEPQSTPAINIDNYYNTTYAYEAVREYKDKFVISVAKGSTKTLTSTWSYKISGAFEGSYSLFDAMEVTAKLGGSVTRTYTTSHKFSGPAESSKYNSREFRVKFYKQKVKVTQTDPITSFKKSATYDKAVKYAEYSIDSKI